LKLTAIIHEENAGYWAEIPALPGCVTQADTLTELEKNLKEAAELWIETAEESAKIEGKSTLQITIYETTLG
jgi:predicted RNase H-like HicB family nuclease